MEWIQTVTIIATLGIPLGFMWKEMKNIEEKMDRKTEQQSNRSDRLYEMFIDLVKEKKQKRDEKGRFI